jgi:hypothetical protein
MFDQKPKKKIDKKDKPFSTQSFYVDLRALKVKVGLNQMLYPKGKFIDHKPKERDPNQDFIGLNQMELARFLNLQNKMYGNDIEKQREIRNLIDYLFELDHRYS